MIRERGPRWRPFVGRGADVATWRPAFPNGHGQTTPATGRRGPARHERDRRSACKPDAVVVHRRSRSAGFAFAALLRRDREQALLRAQAPEPSFTDLVPGLAQLVGEQPLAELRVVVVGVDKRVGEVRVGPLP
jgi:hypothetical protein